MAYTPRLPPYAHQREALDKMRGREAFALLASMRTGKSKILIDDWAEMVDSDEVDDMVVVAPGGVYKTWAAEVLKQLPEDAAEATLIHAWQSGGGTSHDRALKAFLAAQDAGRPRVLAINVEALSSVDKAREAALAFLSQRKAVMAVDECFAAGTQIQRKNDSIAIEDLRPGDHVKSSDGESRVKRIKRKRSDLLVRVHLENGTIITTTPNHPFFTDVGWLCAGFLTGRFVYADAEDVRAMRTTLYQEDNAILAEREQRAILWDALLSEMENAPTRDQSKDLQPNDSSKKNRDLQEKRKNEGSTVMEQGYSDVGYLTSEIKSESTSYGAQTISDWWQRAWDDGAAGEFAEDIRLALETGARHSIGRKAAWLSNLLQGRFRIPEQETGDRVRWDITQQSFCEGPQSQESTQTSGIRVESVEVEKCRNPVDVYDLELEDCPHFFAEGILVHNSTVIKNPSARRSKFIIQKLAPKAAYRRILSGLPTPWSPLDLFSQFEFLDWRILGHKSYYSFRARYAVVKKMDFGGRAVNIVVGYRNTDELWSLIAPHSYRVTLDQVRQAAPPVYAMREVTMTDEQKRIYRELKEFATSAIEADTHVTATAVITQILRLHQLLCGHVTDEEGNVHEVPENRTTELLKILEDYDGKAIIWCSYDHDVRKVSERLVKEYGERSVARFWGGNRDTREEEESRFKNDPECRFEVATPDAGGRGRTWSVADLHVFYSNRDDLEKRAQAEERAEAVDKYNQATRIDLYVPGTVDEKIIHAIRNKITMASAITGDNYREWLI